MASGTAPAHGTIAPRVIIHGGAGAITRSNLPPELYAAHRTALLSVLHSTAELLGDARTTALDAAVHAVTLLELDPLYNAGRGAVFTAAGRVEHEASVMLSTPHPRSADGARLCRKRYAAVTLTAGVRHPIQLAREVLVRGEEEGGGGAGSHVLLAGATAEALARRWGLEVGRPSWAWTKTRWDQHRRGLGLGNSREEYERAKVQADREAGYDTDMGHEVDEESDWDRYSGAHRATEDCGFAVEVDGELYAGQGWNGVDYIPQGTVGCVVLDRYGTIAVATSTGGMTNKLAGRIGDTPQVGAGFWAEQFERDMANHAVRPTVASPLSRLVAGDLIARVWSYLPCWIASLFSGPDLGYTALPVGAKEGKPRTDSHAVGMSGTGNGDSFLRLCCARTVGAMVGFPSPRPTLQHAVTAMAGPGGLLQRSAEDRWRRTGEGEGGVIGIELRDGVGKVVSDFNCGGMFRAWIDDEGESHMIVFRGKY